MHCIDRRENVAAKDIKYLYYGDNVFTFYFINPSKV